MQVQMTLDKKESYYEVIEILNYLDKNLVEKLPIKLINFFKDNCAQDYPFKVNTSLPLKEQNLKQETLIILAMLNINYWSTEEHKEELIKLYSKNEEEYEKKLREKYNPDELFDNKNKKIPETENIYEEVTIVEYKESIFVKIRNWIKEIFH